MKSFAAILAFAAFGAVSAQTSTVTAVCGTACPTGPAPDVTVTRSNPPVVSASTPCPSLVVSSLSSNGSSPTISSLTPPAATFTGGSNQLTGPVGAALAIVIAALAL